MRLWIIRYRFALGWVFVLILGLLAGSFERAELERIETARLLQRAQTLALSLDLEEVRRLHGDARDVANPAFQAMRRHLMNLRTIYTDIRYAYVLRYDPRKKTTVFLFDSEPDNSPTYLNPGSLYQNAGRDPYIQKLYATHRSIFAPPSRDSFGTWVSGLAPLLEETAINAQTTAYHYCGIDVDAHAWNQRLAGRFFYTASIIWLFLGLLLALWHWLSWRKFFQRKIQDSHQFTQEIFHRMSDGFYTLDRHWRFTYINPAAIKLSGETKESDFIGAGIWEKFPFLLATPLEAAYRKAMRDQVPVMIDHLSQRRHTWYTLRLYPSPHDLSVYFWDTTVQREAEEHLRQATELAEQTNRAKGNFLAMISHEIRTPMNGVIGFADLLSQTKLTGEQAEMVGIIQTSAASLLNLLSDILDLSKMEAGRLSLHYEPFLLRDVLENVTAFFSTDAAQKNLALTCRIKEDTPDSLNGDVHRIRQVLLNLIHNALKFTKTGGVDLSVSARLAAPARRAGAIYTITFVIRDTGIGIPPDKQKELFQPFIQVDSSAARAYGGTGLGLAISRRLCELMGGEISLESQPGQGSTFTFTILAETASLPDPAVAAEEIAPLPEKTPLRILVAEDNEMNLRMLAILLEQSGYTADYARNGMEAVEAACRRPYDVILMDVHLPVLDGLAATRRIRDHEQQQQRPRSRIVGITADAIHVSRERCLESGMDDYLTKPVRTEELLPLLKKLVIKK